MRYNKFETSPAGELVNRVRKRLEQENTYYYFICMDNKKVGAIRIIDSHEKNMNKRISPLFILPEYQRKGIAQTAIRLCEKSMVKMGGN
ncbi:GNAT family N-acetyltransferase [Murimonas intestini]|uniref:GNAT family N-acetyltransferase n=1 Tax=Murimonas intestini TaxID=1337051 RepID=UPI001A9BE756|nr:GNAT family N-acetyltransferase [Murimonas intestini]MCR1839261.1 GNAT family N-acetyltransferase [Murimonas intestini]